MPAEDNKEKRLRMTGEVETAVFSLPEEDLKKKKDDVVKRLFGFANYLESKIAMLYYPAAELEFDITAVFNESLKLDKVITFPLLKDKKENIKFYKVDNLKQQLVKNENGFMVPNIKKCREIPCEFIDIAIIPGLAFDEKGGRIASDSGEYDRIITMLPITTRKIALGLEEQIVSQIPVESRKKYVDIIVTDERIIYKI